MSHQPRGLYCIGRLIGANLNSTSDQAIAIIGAQKYVLAAIKATNASAIPTLAAGGIYTAASKGGTAILGAGQGYTGLTSSTASVDLTTGLVLTTALTAQTLYLSLTTANGSVATCDLYIYAYVLE